MFTARPRSRTWEHRSAVYEAREGEGRRRQPRRHTATHRLIDMASTQSPMHNASLPHAHTTDALCLQSDCGSIFPNGHDLHFIYSTTEHNPHICAHTLISWLIMNRMMQCLITDVHLLSSMIIHSTGSTIFGPCLAVARLRHPGREQDHHVRVPTLLYTELYCPY